jgi:branched-chain amino acid aminotransferase
MTEHSGFWVDGGRDATGRSGIPCRDRGFLYGEGVFDTVRLLGRNPFRLESHLDRLEASALTLGVPLPEPGWRERLRRALAELTSGFGTGPGRARITLTAGDADSRGDPAVPPGGTGRLVLGVHSMAGTPRNGGETTALVAGPPSSGPSDPLRRHKTLSYLPNLLCLREARRAGAEEGLVRTPSGEILGGARGNLFLVLDGCLLTPPLESGAFPGLTRRLILAELAPHLSIPWREVKITESALATASEAFLTNAVRGIRPLRGAGGGSWTGPVPGGVTSRLTKAYVSVLARECGTQ